MSRTINRPLKLALALLMLFGFVTSTPAASSFFKGKTLTIVVPSKPGGGYDTLARMIAPYMKKYLDLKDAQILDKPGGGQLIGANHLYNAAPDGLTIGDVSGAGSVFALMNNTPGVHFEPAKFQWLGRVDYDVHVIATHAHGPYQSFDDLVALKGTDTIVKALGTGKGTTGYNTQVIAYNAFGIPFRMIAGFSGSHAEQATFTAGQGDAFASGTTNMQSLGSDIVTVVAAMKTGERFDEIPDVPTIMEEAEKNHLSADIQNSLRAATDLIMLGHPFAAPPGVPEDRVDALREAMKKTFNDPDFIRQEKKSGYFPSFKSGPAIADTIQRALDRKEQILTLLKVK